MDKARYLEISKASDVGPSRERAWYRSLEFLPGVISLGTLAGVFLFSWMLPSVIAIFIICFCLYYLFRIFYFSLHQVIAYRRVKGHMRIDWLRKLREVKGRNWREIYHLVILPSYREGEHIITESLEAMLASNYPKENLLVVTAYEARAGVEFKQTAARIEKKYAGKFGAFLAVFHPDTIPGEIAGKGSNVAYAGKAAKEQIVDRLGIPLENILVSTFDIDTKVYPQYFSCLTWYYLTEKNPLRASYQPIPIYNNNIWKSSFFARVVSTSNTFWQMIQQERAEKLTTYSSHAIPAKVFYEVGYPANVVCDDSRIFWRAYLYYDGDYRVVPIYYLVSMDVVDTPHIFKTALNQYKQQKRWAWGCVEIPFVLFGFLQNKKIPLFKKLEQSYILVDGYWSWATAALLLFALGWLPLMLGGNKFNFSILSFNLPILTGRIMSVAMLGVVVSAFLSTLLLPKIPKGVSRFKRVGIFLQWIFLPAILIVFGSFPALDAQIQLMLGRYMGFWVTEKVRK